VIFMSQLQLEALCEADELFIDGSFKYAPKGYVQIYRIYALLRGTKCVHAANIVTKSEMKDMYKRAFR
jgi:hypothetical protein